MTPHPAPARPRPPAPGPAAFAPVSGALPARVRLAAWYFTVSGALGLLFLAVAVGALVFGVTPIGGLHGRHVAAVLLNALAAAGFLWTGRLLAAGARQGAVGAAVTLLVPLLSRVAGEPVSTGTLVVGAIGAAAVLSAWRDLR